MVVENYTDKDGNVFVPGEKVIVLTTCMHIDEWAEGTYEGVNYSEKYDWETKSYIRVPRVVISKKYNYYKWDNIKETYTQEMRSRKSCLVHNRIYKYDAPLNILVR